MKPKVKVKVVVKETPKPIPHHSGKGTRARLNTAAEKHLFNSKLSS
jgi:hypothetical protein